MPVCERCGAQVVSMREVEEMIYGRKKPCMAELVNAEWRAFSVGTAVQYGKVPTARRGVERAMCMCREVYGLTPSMQMVREKYRDDVKALFGEVLEASVLFALPAHCVAWENCTLVRTKKDEVTGQLQLSAEGELLYSLLTRMAMRGQFNQPCPRFEEHDVFGSFSYLHMLLPARRFEVAYAVGPRASVAELVRNFSLDWFDWARFPMLRAVKVEDSFQLSLDVGVPLVNALANEFVNGLALSYRPLTPGTAVLESSVCVQVLDGPQPDTPKLFRARSGDVPMAKVTPGIGLLPRGELYLRGEYVAVTFEPGINLVTGSAVHVCGDTGITLFLNGDVYIQLSRDPHCADVPVYGCDEPCSFQVAYRCESFDAGTPLGAWYQARFDPRSTEARFATRTSAFLVLHTPVFAKCVLPSAVVSESVVDPYETGLGTGFSTNRLAMRELKSECAYTVCSGVSIVTVSKHVIDPRYDVWWNGFVCADGDQAIVSVCGLSAFMASSLMAMRMIDYDWNEYDGQLILDLHEPSDSYVLDDGGPSDDEGFQDETYTYLEACQSMAELSSLSSISDDILKMHEVYPYTVLAKNPVNLVRQVGRFANLRKLLDAAYIDFDSSKFERVRPLIDANKYVKFVLSVDAEDSWRILITQYSGLGYAFPSGSLGAQLMGRYLNLDDVFSGDLFLA